MLPGQCHSPEDATDVGGSTGRIKCLKPCNVQKNTIIRASSTSEIRSDQRVGE